MAIIKKEGINFVVVSNTFKSDFANFINEVTWKTDIKRFSLITSEAFLNLLVYKSKDQLPLPEIIDAIISLGTSITAPDIIQKFDGM